MTRKQYEIAVKIINTTFKGLPRSSKNAVIDAFIVFFSQENARFDADKFRASCE